MKPIQRLLRNPKSFWASVRSLSQHIGYSTKNNIIVPSITEMADAFRDLHLNADYLLKGNRPSELAEELRAYFEARADSLENRVRRKLIDADEAPKPFLLTKGALN